MKNILLSCANKIFEGILAGILISLGGAVFLACYSPDVFYMRAIGAFLFSLALVCICMRGYALYTGKIGLILGAHSRDDVSLLLLCLLGNAIGTAVCGALIGWMMPNLKETAFALCTAKLGQGYGFALLRGVFCGILVFLAVDIWREHGRTIGILLCIPAFILSGFEHSIADMFYFAASGIGSGEAFLYLMTIVAGNSIGGLIIPALRLLKPRPLTANKDTKEEQEGHDGE